MLPSHFSVVDLGAFAFAIVLGLLVTLFYLFDFSGNKGSSLPGLKPRDPVKGNLDDIGDAGSLHEFLMKIHKDYGPLASFWWGEQQVVSLASPSMWREIQGLFDRPAILFKLFEPLISKYSIQYANGPDGRKRHKLITSSFGHEAMSRYYGHFTQIAEDMVKEWDSISPEEHVPLQNRCFHMTIRGIMISAVGSFFKDEKSVDKYAELYEKCWSEMERRLAGEIPEEGSEKDLELKKDLESMKAITKSAIEERKQVKPDEEEKNLIDRMFEAGYTEEVLYADILSTIIGGFHTSALLLTWSIYYMAKHPEVQERVYEELKDVLDEETVTPQVVSKLTYLKQVLDETIRCAVIAPFAARYSEFDMQIEEHKIPKQTPLIIALGVVHQDPEIWPEPQRFDPDHFDPQEMKQKESLTYEPFGFAGKRKCPGYRFSHIEATVVLSILMRRFKFHLVEGQEFHSVFGLVTKPDKEIFVTLSKRE